MSELLNSRESISPEHIYDQYYGSSNLDRLLVVELLNHIAQELSLPAEKLRPEDRFGVELIVNKSGDWDSGYGILLYELQRLAKKRGQLIDRPIATIDDYVRAMSEVY